MYAIMSFINTQFISNIYTSYFLFLKNWPRPLVQYWIIKKGILFVAVVVQSLSHVRIFVAPWTTAHQVPLFSTDSRVCSNSFPLSQWCHPTISSSATPLSFCLQSFPTSGSFPMSQLFTSGGQHIAASASVLPMNIQGWFPLGWTGLISLLCKWLSRVFSRTTIWKHQSFSV